MIEFFVRRPVTTIMFVAIFVLLGIVAAFNLPLEKDPKIDFPIVTVTVTYPGATPLEVETLVVNKVEDAVAELSEIKKITSQSFDNFGFVSIEFLMTSDVNIKFIEVKDKVEALVNDLPDDIDKPVIEKYDPLMTPVMDLVLSSDTLDGRDLYEFADKRLKDYFSSVKGVANVELYGGRRRQINVVLDPQLMERHYTTILDVISSIRAKNRNIPGGVLEKGGSSLSLRFVGEFASPAEIGDLLVVSRDGTSFPLREIARVEDGFKKVETMARYNGQEVVGLSLTKVSDGNAVEISRSVRGRLDEFRALLPEGVRLAVATDTTGFIVRETRDTYLNILVGILLTVLVLYLFTGRWSLTVIASIAIPTSIISALFLMSASGFTINFMTLLAIATALGTLIANAIVIVENVLVHLDKGDDPVTAAINGTREVTSAVLASAGTNLVVFTPIAFMGGIIGQFFKSFGLTVVYATLFSIFASFTLTPMMCGHMLKKRDPAAGERGWLRVLHAPVALVNRMMTFLLGEYRRIFQVLFRFPKTAVLLVFLLFFSLRWIMPYVGNEFYPDSDEDMLTVKIELPQGTTIDRTSAVTAQIEKRITEIPEMASYLTSIGDDGEENAAVVVNLVPLAERTRSDADIIKELIPFMARIPDAEIMLERGEARGGLEGDISINVTGRDYDRMIALSRQMQQVMAKSGYFRSVKSSYKVPKKEIRFLPDQQRLIEYGLRDSEVGQVIRASVYGDDSNVYKEAGEEYDINVELDDRYAEDFDDLRQIHVISAKGLLPVVELGDLVEDKATPMIRHRDKDRIIRLEGYLAKSSAGYVKGVLDQAFADLDIQPGEGYRYVGSDEYQTESAQETGKAFLLAIILTFMLLCAIMDSILYPVPILLSVATSFIGVFYALFFLEQSINVASMLGMVMLVGLVVNNSILLLDYTLLRMRAGVPVIEALWQAAETKFRPIIMTSLAIILGVLPQLTAVMPVKVSMGVVMIGGMLASIVFTFLFTPVAFWYVVRLQGLFTRRPRS